MIVVLSGVNGAGKSSIGGSALRAAGQVWYNPDEIARKMQLLYPQRSVTEINSQVWNTGYERLQQAVNDDIHFSFETTLGGNSITQTLLDAIAAGIQVKMWYCGLESVELHIQRVAERVARGGHDIPEAMIRKRYHRSMRNLCRLAPGLHQLAVYDNILPLDSSGRPQSRKLLHCQDNELLHLDEQVPDWAKPIAAVCLKHRRK